MDNKRGVNWKEMSDKNLGVLAGSFLNFCREKFLIPHMFNVESLQEILLSIIPPLHKEEYEYFNSGKLIKQYEGDKKKISSNYEFSDGEPELLFHEFMFTLGKIAFTAVNVADADSLTDKFKVFLVEKLDFPVIDNIEEHVEKYFMHELDEEYDLYSSDEDLEAEYVDDPHQILLDFIERRAQKDQNFVLDYEKVLHELDIILPSIPDPPKIEQVNPPPYTQPRELFGK